MADVDSALTRIRIAAESLADWERPSFSPPATHEQLVVLEAAIGRALPADTRALLMTHGEISAMDVHNGYSIGDASVLARAISRGDFPTMVEARPVFAIGSDGGGNVFLASCLGDGPVWKWRHDIGGFVMVAETFVAFLDRLADDVEAFANGKPDWQFMAG